MNNKVGISQVQPPKRFRLDKKWKDVLLIALLGFVLLIAAWKIFNDDDTNTASSLSSGTENERRISRLLEQIDGVGQASVVICETEDGVKGVVVVCEGANDFQVVIDVREAVAAALNVEQKAVKIYLKKE